MGRYAKFNEYEYVRLKEDRLTVSDYPFTQLEEPRAVTGKDIGVIVLVHDVEEPGYEVEFFGQDKKTVDLLTLRESEIELWVDED